MTDQFATFRSHLSALNAATKRGEAAKAGMEPAPGGDAGDAMPPIPMAGAPGGEGGGEGEEEEDEGAPIALNGEAGKGNDGEIVLDSTALGKLMRAAAMEGAKIGAAEALKAAGLDEIRAHASLTFQGVAGMVEHAAKSASALTQLAGQPRAVPPRPGVAVGSYNPAAARGGAGQQPGGLDGPGVMLTHGEVMKACYADIVSPGQAQAIVNATNNLKTPVTPALLQALEIRPDFAEAAKSVQ